MRMSAAGGGVARPAGSAFSTARRISIRRATRRTAGPTGSARRTGGGVPHAHVCGGRGRCSTCRVRILDGAENLNPPGDKEIAVLHRVGAPDGTRLACQSIPTGEVSIIPLLPASATVVQAFNQPGYL